MEETEEEISRVDIERMITCNHIHKPTDNDCRRDDLVTAVNRYHVS